MVTPKELLDELLKDCKTPEDLLGKNGVLKQLTKELMERMLEAEMTDHLGYDKHAPEGRGSGNSRNGASAKTIQGDHGEVPLEVPSGSQRRIRAAGDSQGPETASWLRRKGHLDVRPGDDDAGDPGTPARALRR